MYKHGQKSIANSTCCANVLVKYLATLERVGILLKIGFQGSGLGLGKLFYRFYDYSTAPLAVKLIKTDQSIGVPIRCSR